VAGLRPALRNRGSHQAPEADFARDTTEKDLLVKEAGILARFTHPNVVRLFDLAETEYGFLMILLV
jgi:hypothetical protein